MWSEEMSGMTDLKDKNGHASRRLNHPFNLNTVWYPPKLST